VTSIVLVELLKGGFKLVPSLSGDTLLITLSGNGDMDTSPALGRYLKEMHAELLRIRVKRVVVDCRDLYFMSSSCIKCFVLWIDLIAHAGAAERYSVELTISTGLHWQRRSFEAMKRFAPGIVSLQEG
jgi:hypothetical protein